MGLGPLDRWAIERVKKMISDPHKGIFVARDILMYMIDKGVFKALSSSTLLRVLAEVVRSSGAAWDVATGLRGPDIDDYALKAVFTVGIRNAVKAINGGELALPRVRYYWLVDWALKVDHSYMHFLTHAGDALYSLRLVYGKNEHLECLRYLVDVLYNIASCHDLSSRAQGLYVVECFDNAFNGLIRWMNECREFIDFDDVRQAHGSP